MRVRGVITLTGVLAGALVVAAPRPAGATAVATSSGTVVTVTLVGDETIGFGCTAGKVAIIRTAGNVAPSPAVNCSALTQVTVNGDVEEQEVDGTGLDGAAFTAKPKLVATLAAGADEVTETLQADSLDLGNGNDQLFLRRGGAVNSNLEMSTGVFDEVVTTGTDGNDTITFASTNANVTVANGTTGSPASTWIVKNAEYAYGFGGKGNDVIDGSFVGSGSALVSVYFDGEDGNDTMAAGAKRMNAHGGSGTNTFNLGPEADQVDSESNTDTINGTTDGADDLVRDSDSLRFGGRTLTGFGNSVAAEDTYAAGSQANDLTVRIRPAASNGAVETFSLQRFGQQQIPAGFERISTSLSTLSVLTPRTLADVVVPFQDVQFSGQTSGTELIDVTVPLGGWTDTVNAGTRTIATSSAAVGSVRLSAVSPYKVHGPWTNTNQGFGHRVYRDLLLRFATDTERDLVRDQLTNGTKTRAAIIQSIVGTDTYRGLDVDRVFFRYLRRAADSGGRTYWVNAIRGGRSLRVFRAQLFGSNEYFNKAGATNAGFVTRAYEDVLGRKPDAGGQTYWTNKANSGVERGVIARQFLASSEAKRSLVRDQFLRFLDREPTDDQITSWSKQLDTNPNGEQALISYLAGTTAYFMRS